MYRWFAANDAINSHLLNVAAITQINNMDTQVAFTGRKSKDWYYIKPIYRLAFLPDIYHGIFHGTI